MCIFGYYVNGCTYICVLYYRTGGEEMEQQYLQSHIKNLVDRCNDIELLYLIRSLLGGN